MPPKRRKSKYPPLPLTKGIEEEVDFGLLKTSMQIGGNQAKQIVKGVLSGTLEVQNLLLNEVNYIYECKICQNLFRSMANLVAHKRVFCKEQYYEDLNKGESDKIEIIEPEMPEFQEKIESYCSNNPNKILSPVKKNISGYHKKIVENNCNLPVKLSDCILKMKQKNNEKNNNSSINAKYTVIGQPLDANPNVYSLHKISKLKRSSSKSFSDEEDKSKTAKRRRKCLYPKRKIILEETLVEKNESKYDVKDQNKVKRKSKRLINKSSKFCRSLPCNKSQNIKKSTTSAKILTKLQAYNCDPKNVVCLICDKKLCNVYALLTHMNNLHSEERNIYKCVFCEILFTAESASIRHMQSKHTRLIGQYSKEELKLQITQSSFSVPEKEVENLLQPHYSNSKPRYALMKPVKKLGKSIVRESDTDSESEKEELSLSDGEYDRLRNFIDEEHLKCLQCNREYSCRSNLIRHAYRHLGICRFQCSHCNLLVFNKSELRTHLKRVHKINNDTENIIDLHETVESVINDTTDNSKLKNIGQKMAFKISSKASEEEIKNVVNQILPEKSIIKIDKSLITNHSESKIIENIQKSTICLPTDVPNRNNPILQKIPAVKQSVNSNKTMPISVTFIKHVPKPIITGNQTK